MTSWENLGHFGRHVADSTVPIVEKMVDNVVLSKGQFNWATLYRNTIKESLDSHHARHFVAVHLEHTVSHLQFGGVFIKAEVILVCVKGSSI
jgi:hypothetical protein